MQTNSIADTDIASLAALFTTGPAAILTGAGISTDSGIPDYRGAGSPPRHPMRIHEFMDDLRYRQRFWAGAAVNARRAPVIEPNAGHLAVAALERAGRLNGVITQNVDGLHGRAGARELVELHGNGDVIRCTECDRRWSRSEVLGWFEELNPGFVERHRDAAINPDGDAEVGDISAVQVPQCPHCTGILRPDVVYFGEFVPVQVFARAEALVESAHALIIAGSSLAVNTGIRLVHRAEKRGIPIAVINRGPTAVDARADLRIEGGTSEHLIALAAALGVRA